MSSKHPKPTAAAGQSGHPHQEHQSLLPGLPDHLAQLCISPLPPTLIFSVSRSWRRLLYSPSFPPFLSLYALLSDSESESESDPNPIGFSSFDPISSTWSPLPSPPPHPPLLLRHPSFLCRPLPVQTLAVSGHLIILAATTHRLLPALLRPLAFHPLSRRWLLGPPIPSPRRWCAAGSASGSVYLFSGVGSDYNSDVARSADRWDPRRLGSGWERLPPLRDGRFCREAVEAVESNGKICMVNLKGAAAKEGVVYDIGSDRWEDMPNRLRSGWTGPAAAAEEGGPIYVVDELSGKMRVYDWERDTWKTVVESEMLKGASQMGAGGRRVCVTCDGGAAVVVVDVAAARPGRMWVVYPPSGKRVIAVHVLPRMSRDES